MQDASETLRLLFSGDAMLGRGVNETIRRRGPAYPLAPLVPVTRAADAFFVNLECAVTPRDVRYAGPPKAYYFRADPAAVDMLHHAGVTLVSLANNHALDAGYDGLRDTLALLDAHGIGHVGAGEDARAARRPALLQARGCRLGVLAYCDHQPDFAARAGRPGIRYVDLADPDTPALLAGEVERLAAQVHHVIVAFHWQPNWVPRVKARYRSLAHTLAEAGARIIWGHSPHHFQGLAWIGQGVTLFSTGGLVDDYALKQSYRNDRQLLFEVSLRGRRVVAVRAYPLELEYARTRPAGAEARRWIAGRFAAMCEAVGSRVEPRGDWLHVAPASREDDE